MLESVVCQKVVVGQHYARVSGVPKGGQGVMGQQCATHWCAKRGSWVNTVLLSGVPKGGHGSTLCYSLVCQKGVMGQHCACFVRSYPSMHTCNIE